MVNLLSIISIKLGRSTNEFLRKADSSGILLKRILILEFRTRNNLCAKSLLQCIKNPIMDTIKDTLVPLRTNFNANGSVRWRTSLYLDLFHWPMGINSANGNGVCRYVRAMSFLLFTLNVKSSTLIEGATYLAHYARTYLQTPLPLPEFIPIGQWNRSK